MLCGKFFVNKLIREFRVNVVGGKAKLFLSTIRRGILEYRFSSTVF
jgi:hypothetical protein